MLNSISQQGLHVSMKPQRLHQLNQDQEITRLHHSLGNMMETSMNEIHKINREKFLSE